MPLPSPKKDEKKSAFVQRCLADPIVQKDFKDIKQRVAVCYSQFEQSKKDKK